jgi:hypothetical protein
VNGSRGKVIIKDIRKRRSPKSNNPLQRRHGWFKPKFYSKGIPMNRLCEILLYPLALLIALGKTILPEIAVLRRRESTDGVSSVNRI